MKTKNLIVLVVVAVDGRADGLGLLGAGEPEGLQHSPGQLSASVGVVVVGARPVGCQIVQHGRHAGEFGVEPALLGNEAGCQRDAVEVGIGAPAPVGILHGEQFLVDELAQFLKTSHGMPP